jgi:hypothetical protein
LAFDFGVKTIQSGYSNLGFGRSVQRAPLDIPPDKYLVGKLSGKVAKPADLPALP